MIEKDLALLGSLPVADVTAPLLLAALRKVENAGRTGDRAPGSSAGGQVFRYAIATGRAERNPAATWSARWRVRPSSTSRLYRPEAGRRLAAGDARLPGNARVAAALKLAPLVFVRPGELRSARWADIDLDAAEWRFIASKTKTPHIVPLSEQAVAILRDLHPLTRRSEFVFPGVRSPRRPMSENTINAALKSLGFDSDTMTGHGFRAMARTILDEVLGFRPDFIEHQLAHAVRDPLGRAYNRTAHLPERRKMMQAWADYLDQLREDTGKVVALKRAAS